VVVSRCINQPRLLNHTQLPLRSRGGNLRHSISSRLQGRKARTRDRRNEEALRSLIGIAVKAKTGMMIEAVGGIDKECTAMV
jgi:hypothetical protein